MICKNHGLLELSCFQQPATCQSCGKDDACCGHKLCEGCSTSLKECSVCRAAITAANMRVICNKHGLGDLACRQQPATCEECKQNTACCGHRICEACARSLSECTVCRAAL